MSRVATSVAPAERLRQAFATKRKVLIPFLTSGFPDPATFARLMQTASDAGAGIIEVGIPFSDPVADGPTIQHSSEAALKHGVSLRSTLKQLTELTRTATANGKPLPPIVLMGYVNPFRKFGYEAFAEAAVPAGVCGVIVPDLPTEEAADFVGSLRAQGLSWVPLIAPTTSEVRARNILSNADAFAYYVSVTGVTGSRTRLPDGWDKPLRKLKAISDKPIVVGFGISSAAIAKDAAAVGDGIVVGSALVDRIEKAGPNAVAQTKAFLIELAGAI